MIQISTKTVSIFNIFPLEIIDYILYFTKNSVFELSQVNKYFNQNVKKMRITNNQNYPLITNEHFKQLPNLAILKLSQICNKIDYNKLAELPNLTELHCNRLMMDEHISHLSKLKSLNLCFNDRITNKGVSKLINLTFLDLFGTNEVTYEGISTLTNINCLGLSSNPSIDNGGLVKLTQLKMLDLSHNQIIQDDTLSKLTNLIHLRLSYNKMITEKGISTLTNLTSLDLSYNDKVENKDY
jgi:Leucine-rich repeat (LRR) protein